MVPGFWLENFPFHLDFPVLLSFDFSSRIRWILFWISWDSAVLSPILFLILLIWILLLYFLISLAKSLSILLIFSNIQLLVLLIGYIVLYLSIWLISALNLIISCHLLFLGVFASYCSRAFRYASKLLVSPVSFWRHSELWVFFLSLLSLCPIIS